MKGDDAVRTTLDDLLIEARKLAVNWRPGGLAPDTGAVFRAIAVFSRSYHGWAIVSDTADDSPQAPARFEMAIRMVDPGIYDPALLATALLQACEEVAQENGDPATDPAVRLIASQLAWTCEAAPDLKSSAHLMFEVSRRTFGV